MLLILVLLAVAVFLIAGPLRGRPIAPDPSRLAERSELEAAREAKFREIRDAELDYRTGKLSEADWRGLDRQLRAEAVEILHRLDDLEAEDA